MTNFSQFLPMINNALKEAWSIVGSDKNNSPFLDFDPETSKFNINSDVEYITKGTKLYFNSRLYELLSGFPAKFIEYKGDKNYRIEFIIIMSCIQNLFSNHQHQVNVKSLISM